MLGILYFFHQKKAISRKFLELETWTYTAGVPHVRLVISKREIGAESDQKHQDFEEPIEPCRFA